MTAENQTANPIGIADPDGQVWPFNKHFTPQMQAAGCEPIYDARVYAKRLKSQIERDKKNRQQAEEHAESIRDAIFSEEGLIEEREPVSVAEASSDLGVTASSRKNGNTGKSKSKKSSKNTKTAKESMDALIGPGADE